MLCGLKNIARCSFLTASVMHIKVYIFEMKTVWSKFSKIMLDLKIGKINPLLELCLNMIFQGILAFFTKTKITYIHKIRRKSFSQKNQQFQ